MSILHKTFVDGEILTAGDINDSLNPDTADHIPYAVYTFTHQFTLGPGNIFTYIDLPAGRFTVLANLVVVVTPTAGANLDFSTVGSIVAKVNSLSQVQINATQLGSSWTTGMTLTVTGVVIQMAKS